MVEMYTNGLISLLMIHLVQPFVGCGPDGAVGYLDRWVGNANPSYEHAITYFEGVMQGYGLDRVEVHRFQWNTAWAVNICGYKDGSVYPDEWLIFGAHFDIAPPVAYTPVLKLDSRIWHQTWCI